MSVIKLNCLVLTYKHEKKYNFKKYENDFEIKTKLGDKVKTIVVTRKIENATKDVYLYKFDRLYEINVMTKKNKYSLGVF